MVSVWTVGNSREPGLPATNFKKVRGHLRKRAQWLSRQTQLRELSGLMAFPSHRLLFSMLQKTTGHKKMKIQPVCLQFQSQRAVSEEKLGSMWANQIAVLRLSLDNNVSFLGSQKGSWLLLLLLGLFYLFILSFLTKSLKMKNIQGQSHTNETQTHGP